MANFDARKAESREPVTVPGRLSPRTVAAVWFGVWGFVTSTTLFVGWPLTSGIERVALLAVLPGLAAAGGGAMVGHSLLESEDVGVPLGIGLGVLAAVLAHVLFAPLFAGALWVLERWDTTGGHLDPVGLTLATLALGPVLVGWLTLGVGALAGGLLAFLWSRTVGRDTR